MLTVMIASIIRLTHRSAPWATQLTISSPAANTSEAKTKKISRQ